MELFKGKWLSYFSDLKYNIINDLSIDSVLDKFNHDVIEKLDDDSTILLQLKICSSDKSIFRSISTIERYSKSEFSEVYDIFKSFWNLQMDDYIEIVNEPRIIISYNIVPNEYNNNNNTNRIKNKNYISSNHEPQKYEPKIKGYNLPTTMDFREWGESIINVCNTKAIVKKNSKVKYEVEIKDKELNVNYIVNDKSIFSFNDIRSEQDNMQNFTRVIIIKNKKFCV